jgi:hypothetical protein
MMSINKNMYSFNLIELKPMPVLYDCVTICGTDDPHDDDDDNYQNDFLMQTADWG